MDAAAAQAGGTGDSHWQGRRNCKIHLSVLENKPLTPNPYSQKTCAVYVATGNMMLGKTRPEGLAWNSAVKLNWTGQEGVSLLPVSVPQGTLGAGRHVSQALASL